MRRKITLSCMLIAVAFSYAQESFSGFRSGNYNGIYGALSNPANIAANTHKWDANVFSFDVSLANDQIPLKLGSITNLKKLENDIWDKKGSISAGLKLEALGPSFMYNIDKIHSVAFIHKIRVHSNITNFNIDFLKSIVNDSESSQGISFPYTVDVIGKQIININGWSEYGFSYANLVYQDENHTVKVGGTLKYLQGFSNAYIEMDNTKGKIYLQDPVTKKIDPYLSDVNGRASIVISGIDFLNFVEKKPENITQSLASGKGFGIDFGAIYEYRDENTKDWCSSCNYADNYTFRVGISLLDLGSIKYTPRKDRAYEYLIQTGNKRIYLDELKKDAEEALKDYKIENKSGSYRASLPATLRLIGDYHIDDNFFVALDTQFSIVGRKLQNTSYFNNITITPRYETSILGAYLPIGYNQLSGMNIGTAFRAGPVFLGSGSILSSLVGGKQIDFFFGIRFGN